MPEPEAGAGLGQHPGGTRLVHRRDQLGHAAAQHDRQVGDRELHPEQRRCLQCLACRPSDEAEAIGYGRGQGAGRGTARQRGGARFGDGQAGAAGQRGDQLGDVERVARRPAGEPQQVAVGLAAGQGCHQAGQRLPGQCGEPEPGGLAHDAPQRQQVIALGDRAHHPD